LGQNRLKSKAPRIRNDFMPRLNFYAVLIAVAAYFLLSGISIQDRLLLSTLHQIERSALVEPSATELFEGAMAGMMQILANEYGDGYSTYIPPSRLTRYQDDLYNRYTGFGIWSRIFEQDEEKTLFVGYPFADSPAYHAGLRSGDQIVKIDGTPIAGKTNREIFSLLGQSREAESQLSVLPFGQTEIQDFFVLREMNRLDSVEGDFRDAESRTFLLETHPRIGYIRITSFTESTANEFRSALDKMMQSGAESFILDLRDNSGGDVRNSIMIAQMLIAPSPENNVIVTVRPRNGPERKRTFGSTPPRCTLPMVVLINGETASSSEILAAALQDYQRATVMGTRSFGKGVIQSIMPLPFQLGMLQLTNAEYLRPNGANIHRRVDAVDSDDWGVVPDIVVESSESQQLAVLLYRSLRSNVISPQREAVLAMFRRMIIEEQNGQEGAPFDLRGTAPYYDVQIDEAVRLLQ